MESQYTFIADHMLGRLTKWLRLMGYDVFYSTKLSDAELVSVARREGRILLTRDSGIMKRSLVRDGVAKAVFIKHDQLSDQLKQLTGELGLKRKIKPRCAECNSELKDVKKAAVKNKIPSYVYKTQQKFVQCPECGRIYWQGTHWQYIDSKLAKIEEINNQMHSQDG
jgi:hypothetical protein